MFFGTPSIDKVVNSLWQAVLDSRLSGSLSQPIRASNRLSSIRSCSWDQKVILRCKLCSRLSPALRRVRYDSTGEVCVYFGRNNIERNNARCSKRCGCSLRIRKSVLAMLSRANALSLPRNPIRWVHIQRLRRSGWCEALFG